jgi:hypothetical protein
MSNKWLNMKKTKLFIALCLVSHFVLAQTTTENSVEKQPKNEIGINASLFFRQFMNITNSNATLPDNPFMVTYKHHFNEFVLRGGVGIVFKSTTETNPKFLDTRRVFKDSINFRIGIEKHFPIYKKLIGYWGVDLVGAYSKNDLRIDSGFDVVSTFDATTSYGGGGVFGIEYQVVKRFSFGTEAAYYYLHQISEEKARFSNNPEFNNTGKKVVSNRTQFLPPLSIFMIMKF